MRRNVELKAFDPDPRRSLAVCARLGAEDRGVLAQRDTYFHAPHGRLKLREQDPGGATLIAYARDDRAEARTSAYRLVEIADPRELRLALAETLGERGAVVKRRRLFIFDGVRIHLDDVEGLGGFVELEAVAARDSDLAREHALVARLRAELAITDDRICATGYADLLGL